MKLIANHIHGHIQDGQKKAYSVFFVPRRTMICERVLEDAGVYNGEVRLIWYIKFFRYFIWGIPSRFNPFR
jgi:hypothetical protein